MKVQALKPGYFGKLRAAGDEFEVPDGAKGSWFAPVAAHGPSKPAGKAAAKPAGKPADDDLV